ncbi:hypothetical protein Hanom_Chr03g00199151 [Helianthus anomalus]
MCVCLYGKCGKSVINLRVASYRFQVSSLDCIVSEKSLHRSSNFLNDIKCKNGQKKC